MATIEVPTFYRIIKYQSVSYLFKKGYSRVFVDKQENVQTVIDIIRSMDECEFDGYYPNDEYDPFVIAWAGDYNDLTYNGKFDMDIAKLTALCQEKGIEILVNSVSNYDYEN